MLGPAAIARIVGDRFTLGPVTSCRLHRTYVNEVYRLEMMDGAYAVKLARRGWRSAPDAKREAAILRHARQSGIVVPEPVRAASGDLAIGVSTPEGERALTVHAWLPGVKPPPSFDRRRVGEAVARLHEGLSTLAPSPDDRHWDMRRWSRNRWM
ncbi:MAG: phosphotransferase [Thermomicrobiales bacterium]